MVKLDPGIIRGELPVHGLPLGVDCLLPMAELPVQGFDIRDPQGEALARERGEFDPGDVEPRPVPGRVVDFQAGGQFPGTGRGKRLVEGTHGVGVEIVHHQDDLWRLGAIIGEQRLDPTLIPTPPWLHSHPKRGPHP